jgi:acetamidase/formamidase
MQIFARQLISEHCVGAEWPEFVGRVELGESFLVETVEVGANGPIEVAGVRAGDALAIHIEAIEMEPPFYAPNGGPFIDGERVPLTYRDGWFYWPKRFRLKAEPSVGSVAVLPKPTEATLRMSRRMEYGGRVWRNERGWRRIVRDPRGKHCHQDCRALGVGSLIHLKAQVDGAGLCAEDVHGYIGQGEMAFAAIEGNARVRLRVERSIGWLVDWPLIETPEEILVLASWADVYPNRPPARYVDMIRQAYHSMVEVVAAKVGSTFAEANSIVATAVDIRNCALYGLQGFISDEASPSTTDIAVVAALPKSVLGDDVGVQDMERPIAEGEDTDATQGRD